MDLPGERVADIAMYGRSYAEWCEWFDRMFGDGKGFALEGYKKYCQEIKESPDKLFAFAKKIISAYKRFMAGELALGEASGHFVTPSTLIIDREGKMLGTDLSFDDWCKTLEPVPCGLSSQCEFAPLPPEFLENNKKVAKIFEKAYDQYREEIVTPIAKWLESAHQAYYLIDVVDVYMAGPTGYNIQQRFAESILVTLFAKKSSGLLRKLLSFLKTSVNSVYVVATKADRIHYEFRDNLRKLAEAMLERTITGLDIKTSGFYSCAATVATELTQDGAMAGRLPEDPTNICSWPAVEIPEKWPSETDCWPERNNWRSALPKFSGRDDEAPEQQGLNNLIIEMLSLK